MKFLIKNSYVKKGNKKTIKPFLGYYYPAIYKDMKVLNHSFGR